MSAWRRKAIALFPEHWADFAQPASRLSDVFLALLADATRAHAAPDDDPDAARVLRRVHGYAEWCMRQEGELWNQAAIGFYENLLGSSGVPWERIAPWISPYAAEQIEGTWALGIEGERAPQFRAALRERHRAHYRTHVYSTGEIEVL